MRETSVHPCAREFGSERNCGSHAGAPVGRCAEVSSAPSQHGQLDQARDECTDRDGADYVSERANRGDGRFMGLTALPSRD